MDTIHNNFVKLGEDFNIPLSTKDLFNNETSYWISPNGELFTYDDLACWKYEEEDHHLRSGFVWTRNPTGENIRLRALKFSDDIIVYPAQWGGSYESTPEAWLHICDGKIESYHITTRGNHTWPD